MRSYFLLIIIFLMSPSFLLAQEILKPEEEAIVLPDRLLEIKDSSPAEVEAGLELQEDIEKPKIEIPLPEEGRKLLSLDFLENKEVFDLPIPLKEKNGESHSLLSKIVLGGGLLRQLLADIELSRIKSWPRFQMKYHHYSLDGFLRGSSFEAAGSGFSSREDEIKLSLLHSKEKIKLRADASFLDKSMGLQQLCPGYESSLQRRLKTEGQLRILPLDTFSMLFAFDFTFNDLVLSADQPEEWLEFILKPRLFFEWKNDKLKNETELHYRWQNFFQNRKQNINMQASMSHKVFLLDKLRFYPGKGISLGADLAIGYHSLDSLLWQALAEVKGPFQDWLLFKLNGGYFSDARSHFDEQEMVPVLVYEKEAPAEKRAGAEGQLRFLLPKGFSIEAALSYWYRFNAPDFIKHSSGLYSRQWKSMHTLKSELSFSWKRERRLALECGWKWNALEQDIFSEEQQFFLKSTLNPEGDKWRVFFDLKWNYYDSTDLRPPIFNLSGRIIPWNDIQFILDINDVFALFLSDGRKRWGDFIAPGFNVILKTDIKF